MPDSPSTRPPRAGFKKTLLTGLLTLFPIWLTWVVVKFVFVMLSDVSKPWVQPITQGIADSDPGLLRWFADDWVQTTVAMIATLLVILLVGSMSRRVIGQRLIAWFETLIDRVPLANTIYGSARKLLDILQKTPDGTQRVVLIDFPHAGMKSVGFVTRVIRDANTGKELAAIYVPTTPNPTSGYLEIVPLDQVTPTDWTVDQAMSFIISGGAVSPETIPYSSTAASSPQPQPAA